MPYKDSTKKHEWDRMHRAARIEAFVGSAARKQDLEKILRRKLTWAEFRLYDAGEAIAPDSHPAYTDPEWVGATSGAV